MACCALAAFLISQIILFIDQFRALLGFSAPVAGQNANVTWRLGAETASGPTLPPQMSVTRSLRLAVSGGLSAFVLLAGAYLAWPATFDATVQMICTAGGLVSIAHAAD